MNGTQKRLLPMIFHSNFLLKASLFTVLCLTTIPVFGQNKDFDWKTIFQELPAPMQKYVTNTSTYKTQIIYTQIDRDTNNVPSFHTYTYGDLSTPFYPASVVKLPTAMLALEKLNELQQSTTSYIKYKPLPCANYTNNTSIYHKIQENQDAEEIAMLYNVPVHKVKIMSPKYAKLEENRLENIEDIMSKMLIYSNNVAYCKMYDFVGQKKLIQRLQDKKYNTIVKHRFASCSPEENKSTSGFWLLDDNFNTLYEQESLYNDSIVPEGKNKVPLPDLHRMVQTIVFPESFADSTKFNLTPANYDLLRTYLAMRPSDHTTFRDSEYANVPDNMTNYFVVGVNNTIPASKVKIYNIVGRAYNYLIDCAYIIDWENNTEFMLSAVVYAGEAMPYMEKLGRIFLDYEKNRNYKIQPDLSLFR